ncbi:hypothetical protein niasHT_004041 [Heterodera trifolii]|uniref:Coiled-coil domain-containing protein 86 n=1 Tax=Heterodera trifolii TaxID=157864 RepID=A0ABD2LZQ6_9BILA
MEIDSHPSAAVQPKPAPIEHQQEEQQQQNNTRILPKSKKWWKKALNIRPMANSSTKPRSSWERKMQKKGEREQCRAVEAEIRQRLADERNARAQALKEREQRRKSNERKAEVVQVIRNSAKLKRMKRKQLRTTVQMRDTTATASADGKQK